MIFLRALGAALVIIASVALFTFAYAAIFLSFHDRGAVNPSRALDVVVLFASPLYWILLVALIAGVVWLFIPYPHPGH